MHRKFILVRNVLLNTINQHSLGNAIKSLTVFYFYTLNTLFHFIHGHEHPIICIKFPISIVNHWVHIHIFCYSFDFVFKKISVLKDCNSNGLKNLSETKLTIKAIKFFFINLKTLKNLAEFSNIC